AETLLGDDLAKELLFTDLQDFSDEEVAHGVNLMRKGQESVFADGHSIYALIEKWVKRGREDLRRQARAREIQAVNEARSEELMQAARQMTPEKMAINKHRISLLASGKIREATRLGDLPEEEALKMLPDGALRKARRMWDAAHAGHFKQFQSLDSRVLPAGPPCPRLPSSSGEES
ncbi:MAG: hypothetical protein ACYTG5_13405, partial [Planctomycetota bacterium]